MTPKKNGCGFLIIALALLVIGGIIAGILLASAASTGKEFFENINEGESFVTPASLDYTSETNEEVTVWLTSDSAPAADTIKIEFTDAASGETSVATTSGTTSSMGNQHLVATFSVAKGSTYQVKATGVADGQTLNVAGIDSSAAMSMLGKGFGAFAAFGVCALLALILGIIGLVKYFGSKNASPAPPAA